MAQTIDEFQENLDDEVEEFEKNCFYNETGDCIECYLADVAIVEDRIDEVLTLFRSYEDGRPIGFQIKGVKELVELLEADGMGVQFKTENRGEKGIKLRDIAIAALEISNDGEELDKGKSGSLKDKADFLEVYEKADPDRTITV